MKNIQIIDGALNATFSLFQATADEFDIIFPNNQDIEVIEDLIERVGEHRAGAAPSLIWERPVLKRDAQGIHGTLYYHWSERRQFLPLSKRKVDWEENAINHAQSASSAPAVERGHPGAVIPSRQTRAWLQ